MSSSIILFWIRDNLCVRAGYLSHYGPPLEFNPKPLTFILENKAGLVGLSNLWQNLGSSQKCSKCHALFLVEANSLITLLLTHACTNTNRKVIYICHASIQILYIKSGLPIKLWKPCPWLYLSNCIIDHNDLLCPSIIYYIVYPDAWAKTGCSNTFPQRQIFHSLQYHFSYCLQHFCQDIVKQFIPRGVQ